MHSGVRKVSLVNCSGSRTRRLWDGACLVGGPKKSPEDHVHQSSPSEGATLTTNSVEFAFTYNRTPKQTQSLVCTLSGPTSASGACDAPVASGRGSQSGKSYGGLANGSYSFTVSPTLTDGGTPSATRYFNVAVPVRHLYWANIGTNTIGRASLDGTGADQGFISGAATPAGVAVDAGHVYWANDGTNTIGRANLDGTGADQIFIHRRRHPGRGGGRRRLDGLPADFSGGGGSSHRRPISTSRRPVGTRISNVAS
jgi:hypothetical protein